MNDSLGREVGAEQWIADDLLFLELSIRAKFDKAERWQRRFDEWAADGELGVAVGATTKTRRSLSTFAAGWIDNPSEVRRPVEPHRLRGALRHDAPERTRIAT